MTYGMKYQNPRITKYPQMGGDISNPANYPTSTNEERHFKPQVNNQIPTNGGRQFKPQVNSQIPTSGGRHFKPQDINPNEPTKIAHITKRGRHFKPSHLETNNTMETLNKSTQQTFSEEFKVLKQLQKT